MADALFKPTPVGDLGPAPLNLKGVRANDKNEMVMTLMQDGLPLDLTGMVLEAQARVKATDPDPPAIVAETEVLDPTSGRLVVRWPGDQVEPLVSVTGKWKGVWDLQEITGGELPETLVAGTFEAEMDVTR